MDKSTLSKLRYSGLITPKPGELSDSGELLYPYLPGEELKEAVNLACDLERPLLLKGEPGCGKTRLARAVAYELGLPYEAWYVKSTSRARDGLYTYHGLARLHDLQLAQSGVLTDEEKKMARDPFSYIDYGPLGSAFRSERHTVVLIDEIDKADIDFPNDLLLELDEARFFIEETRPRQEIRAKVRPLVFITSNDEKDLPDAFLRRCLFHYIKFPSQSDLVKIMRAHFPDSLDHTVLAVVERFLELRHEMEERGAVKKVSVSELLDWYRVLQRFGRDELLSRLKDELVFPSILLKSWDDYQEFHQQTRSSGKA